MVSLSSARLGQGAAPIAHAQAGRALQLLRCERQHRCATETAVCSDVRLEEVARPKKPACAYGMEAVPRAARSSPASSRLDQSADLEHSVSRSDRRAGWWKSPCPDLVRAAVVIGCRYST